MTHHIPSMQLIARQIRMRIIETSHKTHTPHLGSCLSCVDLLVVLYFSILRVDAKNPRSPERDRFILSKGHGAPALFQVLARKGFYHYVDLIVLVKMEVFLGSIHPHLITWKELRQQPDRLAMDCRLGWGWPLQRA